MRLNFFVIDEFYVDIDAVRAWALTLDYPHYDTPANDAGSDSATRFLPEGLDGAVSDIVRQKVVGDTEPPHGHFRLAHAEHGRNQDFRIQMAPDIEWSAILYMSRDEDCQGGTEFYRHIATASDNAPVTAEELTAWGVGETLEAADPIIERDSNDLSKWEHLFTVPMRYNRLILFRPNQWHTSGPAFGDRPENARLTQMFFFRAAAG